MISSIARRAAAAFAVGALLLILASPVAATVDPPCTATGTSTSTPSIDLTTATEWHLLSTDVAGGDGKSTVEMKSGSVAAYALGLPIPIASGSGDGNTEGSVSGVAVSTYAFLGHRFVVAGSATGDNGGCKGQVEIILDDVNPLFTVFGGGGLALFLVGLVVVLLDSRSGGGCVMQLLGGIFGGLGGAGLGLALAQFGVLDARSLIGLAIAIVGAILGFGLAGRFGGSQAVAA